MCLNLTRQRQVSTTPPRAEEKAQSINLSEMEIWSSFLVSEMSLDWDAAAVKPLTSQSDKTAHHHHQYSNKQCTTSRTNTTTSTSFTQCSTQPRTAKLKFSNMKNLRASLVRLEIRASRLNCERLTKVKLKFGCIRWSDNIGTIFFYLYHTGLILEFKDGLHCWVALWSVAEFALWRVKLKSSAFTNALASVSVKASVWGEANFPVILT